MEVEGANDTPSNHRPMAMDIPAHILDAVHDTSLAIHRTDTSKSSPRKPSRTNLTLRSALSSAEDLSTTSDSEQEHGYQTDFTSPPSSESCTEDMQPDDVEDFRDREYPQLKGKTYLDHGGTTVSSVPASSGTNGKLICTSALRAIPG